ncbi:MAG: FAD-dependent oxidoreductase, partial [Polyangia bacterium]
MDDTIELHGPDLTKDTSVADLGDGKMLLGHAHGEPVLLARRGDEIFAVGATCTHYSGPLAEGLIVGDEVHCPWHHACFSLRTGEASAPAMNPIPCYALVRKGDRVTVGEKLDPKPREKRGGGQVVIVGAGAAGALAAESLRRHGYDGKVVLLGAEGTPPIDRPNLSKDYLSGDAQEEWMELRSAGFYAEQRIDFRPDARVASLDTTKQQVVLATGEVLAYDDLVLATGAEPIKLDVKGGEHAHVLRTLADSKGIMELAKSAKRVVVIGASFIGLEVAASLRKRGLEVHVVGPEAQPLVRVLGEQLSAMVRKIHEDKGVVFHLGKK